MAPPASRCEALGKLLDYSGSNLPIGGQESHSLQGIGAECKLIFEVYDPGTECWV